ncbi:MFS transporter [Rothia sp. CCM 9416]|uniref:MFS transporter n=1 Tax=Rothia sp. CCM 9416 TaxID=3402655 RepID=UPI003ADC69DB
MNIFKNNSGSTNNTKHILYGHFLLFFIGRNLSIIGSSMTPIALTLGVLSATGSITETGIFAASGIIPTLILMLFGGIASNRFSKGTILFFSHIINSLLLLYMGILLMNNNYDRISMIILNILSGAISGFTSPALRSIIPDIVDPSNLQKANALLSSSRSLVRLGSPLLAGILFSSVGGGVTIIIDAITSAISAIIFLNIPSSSMLEKKESILSYLRADFKYFFTTKWLLISSVSFSVINALNVAPFQILGSSIVVPAIGAFSWGIILTGRTFGMFLFSTILYKIDFKYPLIYGRILGGLTVLPLFGFSFSHNLFILTFFAFMGGIGFSAINITYDSTLQRKIPKENLSGVMAIDDILAFSAIPVMQLGIGPLADLLGKEIVSLWCGIGMLIAILSPLLFYNMLKLDRKSMGG